MYSHTYTSISIHYMWVCTWQAVQLKFRRFTLSIYHLYAGLLPCCCYDKKSFTVILLHHQISSKFYNILICLFALTFIFLSAFRTNFTVPPLMPLNNLLQRSSLYSILCACLPGVSWRRICCSGGRLFDSNCLENQC